MRHRNWLAGLIGTAAILVSGGCRLGGHGANPAQVQVTQADYCVATNGNDAWSGKLVTPNPGNTDGPFASVTSTRDGSGRNTVRSNRVANSLGYGRVARQGDYQSPHLSFGIYLDDYLSETTVSGILVYRAWNGCVNLHGGWNNTVEKKPSEKIMFGDCNATDNCLVTRRGKTSFRHSIGAEFPFADGHVVWLGYCSSSPNLRDQTAAGPWHDN